MSEWVSFETDRYDAEDKPITEKGEVVQWVVVPDEVYDRYSEGPATTDYNVSAIVKCDDASFKVVRVEQLHSDRVRRP